ncbi:glutathione S-transferase-like [Diorhabda sublineata]|uniref:glutathione S-transferase-like n=1 Tax=Diorhabda sublineata TaxID=1163346 RepID=UPI0024E0DE3B|nr:glutathione S-transferase-like [Diorhabda sublineata]
MNSSYKVYYFDVPGKAEPIRMLLSYGGYPFEDVRFEKLVEWPKHKKNMPFEQVPVLEIDGKKLTQTVPLTRFLANLVNLAGKDYEENYEIDSTAEIIGDIYNSALDFFFERDEHKKRNFEIKMQSTLSLFLPSLEERAKKNGGFIALNRLTWPDLCFTTYYQDIRNILGKDFLHDYPNLQHVKKHVLAVENIRNWIKRRPLDPAFAYTLKDDL